MYVDLHKNKVERHDGNFPKEKTPGDCSNKRSVRFCFPPRYPLWIFRYDQAEVRCCLFQSTSLHFRAEIKRNSRNVLIFQIVLHRNINVNIFIDFFYNSISQTEYCTVLRLRGLLNIFSIHAPFEFLYYTTTSSGVRFLEKFS